MLVVWSEVRAERVRRDLVAACAEPLGPFELLSAVADLVDQAVPADASCWSTFDPDSVMITSAVARDLDESAELTARFFELEYALQAPGQYRQLASARTAVSARDRQDVERHPGGGDIRDFLGQLGIDHELRVLLHQQGAAWGGAGLMRGGGTSFNPEEAAFLGMVAPVIASGVRAAVLRGVRGGEPHEVEGPAVLVLDRSGVVEATPAAVAWTDRLRTLDTGHGAVPGVLRSVGARALAGGTVTHRTQVEGRWLVLRGAPLGPGRAVVTIEVAGPHEVVGLLTSALGLTGREVDVVAGVLRGSSTKDIARTLAMSPYTVQDHLKSVFAKAGVGSRRELLAEVFFGVYLPRLAPSGAPPPAC